MRQLFMAVLSLSLSGTLTGLILMATHPITEKYFSKRWNYYVWLLVVAQLALPLHFFPVLSGGLNWQPDLHQTTTTPLSNADPAITARQDNDTENYDSSPAQNQQLADDSNAAVPGGNTTADLNAISVSPGIQNSRTANTGIGTVPFSAAGILTVIAYIWLFSAITILLAKLLNYCRFTSRVKRDCTRITDSRVTILENTLCTKLHIDRIPAIYESAAISSPMTVRAWRPVIVIPKTFLDQSDKNETENNNSNLERLQLALHHELVHVARKDLLYKWIYQLLLCVHWFNPILYPICRQMNRDCELACDEAILTELTEHGKQLYGNILLDTAALGIDHRGNALSTTLLESRKDLKKRLDSILHYQKTTRLQLALSVCALAVMLALSACSTVWINPDVHTLSTEPDQSSDTSKLRDDDANGHSPSADPDQSSDTLKLHDDANGRSPYTEPDQSSDAWRLYDDDELLAGDDIQEYWGAYNYFGSPRLWASDLFLYGSDTLVIAYAGQDVEVTIQSSFDVADGKFKIIYIAPDKSIVTLNDAGSDTAQTITMQKGRNVIKMAGQQAHLKNLRIDYSDLRETDFQKVYYSEGEEYCSQILEDMTAGKPIQKDKAVDALIYLDAHDASEVFNALLSAGTTFTDDELYSFFLYSDAALSSQYLLKAIQAGNVEPPSAEAISELMPYVTGDCQTELLKSLSVEEFYDIFAENIYYLNDRQIDECLTDYIDRGGVVTYSMYDAISYYINEDSTLQKLDEQLPSLRELP